MPTTPCWTARSFTLARTASRSSSDLMRRRIPQHFYAFDLLWLKRPGPSRPAVAGTEAAGVLVRPRFLLEGNRPILEELLLPAVEDPGLQTQFIAELRDRLLLHQMPPQDGDLLFRRVGLPLLLHAFSPLPSWENAFSPVQVVEGRRQLRQGHGDDFGDRQAPPSLAGLVERRHQRDMPNIGAGGRTTTCAARSRL